MFDQNHGNAIRKKKVLQLNLVYQWHHKPMGQFLLNEPKCNLGPKNLGNPLVDAIDQLNPIKTG